MCTCDKARFESRREAKRQARRLNQNGAATRGPGALSAYRCPDEPSIWHLTSCGARDKAWHRRGER